jgi:hypothetical protein
VIQYLPAGPSPRAPPGRKTACSRATTRASSRSPWRRRPGPIVGRTTGGTLLIPAPVDYVAWTERAFRVAQRDDLKVAKRIAWLSGRMSPRAQKEFTARGWTVYESFTIAAER